MTNMQYISKVEIIVVSLIEKDTDPESKTIIREGVIYRGIFIM